MIHRNRLKDHSTFQSQDIFMYTYSKRIIGKKNGISMFYIFKTHDYELHLLVPTCSDFLLHIRFLVVKGNERKLLFQIPFHEMKALLF